MKKIIICDDHPIVREGLKLLIQGLGMYEILDDVASGEALMKSINQKTPDIVVLDVSLPGRSGLEVLKSIKTSYPEVNVLILSMYPEDQFALRMIKAGASGYLHKDSKPEILKEALEKISRNQEYVSPAVTKILIEAMNGKGGEAPAHSDLSDREFEVFLALGEGMSLSDIGNKLNLSVKTISTYKTRIYDKMNMENTSDIVKYILMHNLNLNSNQKSSL